MIGKRIAWNVNGPVLCEQRHMRVEMLCDGIEKLCQLFHLHLLFLHRRANCAGDIGSRPGWNKNDSDMGIRLLVHMCLLLSGGGMRHECDCVRENDEHLCMLLRGSIENEKEKD